MAEGKKILLVVPEDIAKNFISGDPKVQHRAEQSLQDLFNYYFGKPTDEQQFEAKKRDEGEGLLIRQEDLKTGEVQIGYLGETGDYILICGPDYDLDHVNEFPVSGTTQLTIKRRKDA